MSEQRLRQSYDMMLALRASQGKGREKCPDPDRLLSLVERTGSEQLRLGVLDHVMACPFCQPEFELLRSAHRASGELPRPVDE